MTEKRPRIGVVGSSNVDVVTYIERMPVWGETIAAASIGSVSCHDPIWLCEPSWATM
jgi:hypothetical protein